MVAGLLVIGALLVVGRSIVPGRLVVLGGLVVVVLGVATTTSSPSAPVLTLVHTASPDAQIAAAMRLATTAAVSAPTLHGPSGLLPAAEPVPDLDTGSTLG